MTKRLFFSTILIVLCAFAHAQASFKYTITQKNAKTIVITFTGQVEKGWHVEPTLSFEETTGIVPEGDLKKIGKNVYAQNMRIRHDVYSMKGYLRYICCNDVECHAPQYLDFSYNGKKKAAVKNTKQKKVVKGKNTTQGKNTSVQTRRK